MADRGTRGAGLAPLTGVLFVVLIVVALLIGGEAPDADDPIGEVVDYWVDNEGVSIAGSLLEVLGAVALIFFAASVRGVLRRREDGSGILSTAAMGGGVVAAAGIGVDAAIRFAAADLADDVDPVVIQTLNAMWSDFFFPMVIGLGTLILATSLAGLRTRVIPAWLAWIGIVICIAFATPVGFIAFLVGGLWLLILSILLWRQEAAAATGPATTAV
jgi:hypothetical protein